MRNYEITRLVIAEDLNHHGTLYAGRSAEWLVESAFIAAAAEHGRPQDVFCVNVHGFTFKEPVQLGDIINFKSRVAKVGKTSITVYVEALSEISKKSHLEGYLTFVCVDPGSKKIKKHKIVIDEPADAAERKIRERASRL
jgi:acyl-CoA hydrolase